MQNQTIDFDEVSAMASVMVVMLNGVVQSAEQDRKINPRDVQAAVLMTFRYLADNRLPEFVTGLHNIPDVALKHFEKKHRAMIREAKKKMGAGNVGN